ncbi:MAG: hypothetical protein IKR12_00510 [Clostridia bacterium]|nr:hypothetical protein [Clostridia bacterium]
MKKFFNTVLNTLIRDLPYGLRVGIAAAFLFVAVFSLYKSLRKKNDIHPIAWGWMILFVLSLFMTIVYLAL